MTDPIYSRWFAVALLCGLAALAWPSCAGEEAGESFAELEQYKALLAAAAAKLEAENQPDAPHQTHFQRAGHNQHQLPFRCMTAW